MYAPWSCQMCMAVSRVTIFLSQHFPHVRQELIIGCACQIPHGQLCGVNQTPRSPRSDKADILADTRIHNRTFAIYIINAIDDNIIRATAHQLLHVIFRDKLMQGTDARLWVDVSEPVCKRIHFESTNSGLEGVQLPVGVCYTDLIQVHQSDGTDATAHQGLSSPGPNTPNPNNADICPVEPIQGPISKKATNTSKSVCIFSFCCQRICCVHDVSHAPGPLWWQPTSVCK
uniref:Uncharacterized protein n=1 Tax=Eutreptiella gymnastica TaxID=73025 RepID=A0A7S4LHI3_9EUGL